MNVDLSKITTKPPKWVSEKEIKKETKKLHKKMIELQRIMYAQDKYSMLIVLQWMDASGKDGTIKKLFSGVNPLGCTVAPFKAPNDEEAQHDFLRRIHKHAPARGMMQIFNRSHYEDVLVPKVEKYISKSDLEARYDDIKNFETLLSNHNTIILKFYLHISRPTQKKRLEERLNNPHKYWKHKDNDWDSRSKWDDYMEAYEDVFDRTNTRVAPWHIIPSDENRWKVHQIISIIVATMKDEMRLRWPDLDSEIFEEGDK